MSQRSTQKSGVGTEFEFEIVDFQLRKPGEVRAMVAQIEWPENHFQFVNSIFTHTDHAYNNAAISKLLKAAELNTVDLLLLPELSVPTEALEIVRGWSDRTGATVIAGSHYIENQGKTVSVSPIFVSGQALFTEKINPAPGELSPIVGRGVSTGEKIVVVRNSPVGNFAVLICADYLDTQLKNHLPLDDLDFLCVPAFQKSSNAYHDRMNIECGERPNGLYSLYSNASVSNASDGSSAIFGVMDRMYQSMLVAEGYTQTDKPCKLCEVSTGNCYIIADFSLERKKPEISRTIHTKPNVHLVEAATFSVEDGASFIDQIGRSDDVYERITDYYVEPKEFPTLVETVRQKNFVIITGDPGIGKTYTAVRLLKEFYDEGYAVRWLSGLDTEERNLQRKILENFKPNENEVIYFEDPFGRTAYENRDTLRSAFRPLVDSLSAKGAKLIVTSRTAIFEQFSNEAVNSTELKEFVQEMNIVKPSYDKVTMGDILSRISAKCAWNRVPECKDFVERSVIDGKFATPLALRDFVRSSAGVDDLKELAKRVSRRQSEERDQFAAEIIDADFETKLLLSLIFLFGTHQTKRLSDWFNKIGSFMKAQGDWVGTSPMFKALRRQIGHRVEHHGKQATSLRFVHPFYEEAFQRAYLADIAVQDIVETALNAVARENLFSGVIGVFRTANRYPEMVDSLLRSLRPILLRNENNAELSFVVNKLAGLSIQFHNDLYQEAMVELLSHDALKVRLLSETDMSSFNVLFRAFYNYRLVTGSEVLELDSEAEKLFAKMVNHNNYATLLDAFFFFCMTYKASTRKLIKSLKSPAVLDRVLALKSLERDRFISIFYKCGFGSNREVQELQELLKTRPKKRQLMKKDWPEHSSSGCQIVIDDGAAAAMRSHASSLLPVGVTAVVGDFDRGEVVEIVDERRNLVAHGMANYASFEIDKVRGLHSSQIGDHLGYFFQSSVVLRNKLILATA